MKRLLLLLVMLAAAATLPAQSNIIRIPAATAYLEPDVEGASLSARAGLSGWKDRALKVLWFGELKHTGALGCGIVLTLPEGAVSGLRLTVAGQSRAIRVTGKGKEPVEARFGTFEIKATGYQRFTLESLNPVGKPFGDIESLVLDGPACLDAHFNLKPRRNAASVHLAYPVPKETQVEAFYCEMTALEDPLWTYYMACGWHRGYFGMQVNSPKERRIIFSVWDSGGEAADRGKVADDNRVKLLAKGAGVFTGDFGNEGTGGHSHLKYGWATGARQRFLVTAKPEPPSHTVYSGYYYHPEKKEWMLISSWRAPKEGGWLRGLYSFSENFGGANGHLQRKALYGNQWIRTSEGRWQEITTASFSHDATGRADRLDRFMGVEQGQFFLSHGGFGPGFTRFGEKFTRPATGKAPDDLRLPSLPVTPSASQP